MQNWQNLIVSEKSSLRDALVILNDVGLSFILVVDDTCKLIGFLTDGDVRRSLLKGITLEDSVKGSINENFIYCEKGTSPSEVSDLLNKYKINYLPELSDAGQVINVHSSCDIHLSKTNCALIMAGGLGTRLKPLTDDCPKPMLKVGDKPILEIIIESLISQGFSDIYISINYLGDMIRDYFGNGNRLGINIFYLEENTKLGTAGALGLLPKGLNKPIVVLNGDVLTKADYSNLVDYHLQNGAHFTIGLTKQEMTIPYGVVSLDHERIISIDEKPTKSYYVNAGIYCISPEAFADVTGEEYLDMPDLITQKIILDKHIVGFPLHEYWTDIGLYDHLAKAKEDYIHKF